MIKQVLLVFVLALVQTMAFVPIQPAVVDIAVQAPQQLQQLVTPSQQLQQGVQSFLMEEPTSMTVSLKERVIPTAEEVAAKKRNFNFW